MSAADITRSAIRTAFLELLKEKRPEKITVTDISEKCGRTPLRFWRRSSNWILTR